MTDPARGKLDEHADDTVGPHQIVSCLAVTSTCEVDHAVTFGPFGFERDVVLKRILAGLDEDEVIRAAGRLLREAAALARLSHPAIVRLYELTEHAGMPVLVLEHVDGPSLAKLLDELEANGAPLDDACALYVGYRIFWALSAAHQACDPASGAPAPVVHGDVAPSNVLVPWDGHVKLADFDLSSGHGLGTPGFAAPERLRGGVASTRSDVFSACVLLRELLLRAGGVAPTDARLSDARPGLRPALVDVIEQGLSLDPRGRSVSAAQIAARLREVVDLESARERLVRHMSAFVRKVSVRERSAVRPPPRAVEAREVEVEVEVEAAPEPLSSLRPTSVSVPPGSGSPDSDRRSLSALRTVKTARRRRQRAARIIIAGAAGVGLAAAGGLFVHARMGDGHLLARTEEPAVAPAAAPPPHESIGAPMESAVAPAFAIPTAASEEARALPSDKERADASALDASTKTGRILTEAGTSEHRVFVDGKSVGHGGTPIVVVCGRHLVRIGSSGPSKTIDVPCGGDVTVTR